MNLFSIKNLCLLCGCLMAADVALPLVAASRCEQRQEEKNKSSGAKRVLKVALIGAAVVGVLAVIGATAGRSTRSTRGTASGLDNIMRDRERKRAKHEQEDLMADERAARRDIANEEERERGRYGYGRRGFGGIAEQESDARRQIVFGQEERQRVMNELLKEERDARSDYFHGIERRERDERDRFIDRYYREYIEPYLRERHRHELRCLREQRQVIDDEMIVRNDIKLAECEAFGRMTRGAHTQTHTTRAPFGLSARRMAERMGVPSEMLDEMEVREMLRVPSNEPHERLTQAYRAFALEYHPDRNVHLPADERDRRATVLQQVTAVYGRIDEQVRARRQRDDAARRQEDACSRALNELNERHKREQEALEAEKGALDLMEWMRRHAEMTSRQMAETVAFAQRRGVL